MDRGTVAEKKHSLVYALVRMHDVVRETGGFGILLCTIAPQPDSMRRMDMEEPEEEIEEEEPADDGGIEPESEILEEQIGMVVMLCLICV